MKDFVIEKECKRKLEDSFAKIYRDINTYACLLSKKLELGMFVPCDEDGKPMEEPSSDMSIRAINYREQYQKAQERVLFKGFELKDGNYKDISYLHHNGLIILGYCTIHKVIRLLNHNDNDTIIEKLIPYKVELTETAIKELGL